MHCQQTGKPTKLSIRMGARSMGKSEKGSHMLFHHLGGGSQEQTQKRRLVSKHSLWVLPRSLPQRHVAAIYKLDSFLKNPYTSQKWLGWQTASEKAEKRSWVVLQRAPISLSAGGVFGGWLNRLKAGRNGKTLAFPLCFLTSSPSQHYCLSLSQKIQGVPAKDIHFITGCPLLNLRPQSVLLAGFNLLSKISRSSACSPIFHGPAQEKANSSWLLSLWCWSSCSGSSVDGLWLMELPKFRKFLSQFFYLIILVFLFICLRAISDCAYFRLCNQGSLQRYLKGQQVVPGIEVGLTTYKVIALTTALTLIQMSILTYNHYFSLYYK